MRSKSKFVLFAVFLVLGELAFGQNHYKRFGSIDIIQYNFEIYMNDTTDRIEATADIIFQNKKPVRNLTLDLTNVNSNGSGMKVESVKTDNENAHFIHENNQLIIYFQPGTGSSSNNHECVVKYAGIPADGLIISKNKYGDRTFFGDNWPDRARNWLPTVDHPSDKAKVTFAVVAPDHYKVVSNGKQNTVVRLKNGYTRTVWKENIPISTKVMVIGAADFVTGNDTVFNGIPVNAWVFKENVEKGLENYRFGTKALEYYSELIGPYSYEKLAHVQSKTRYGGMENASCIFYSENSAISGRSQENLFAHEVAHQWFGNSATEQNWHHVWLSEGFATYLTHLYNKHFYGEDVFLYGLKSDRESVIRFARRFPAPVIDTTVTEYTRLLNANSYQKASWFLHMLRCQLGDDVFFKGLKSYYSRYRNSTAVTADFRKVMEEVSGEDLRHFFDQWLRQAGHPVLKWSWKQTADKNIKISVKQTQPQALFSFPLDLEVQYLNGKRDTLQIDISEQNTHKLLSVDDNVQNIVLDPEVRLLFETVK